MKMQNNTVKTRKINP